MSQEGLYTRFIKISRIDKNGIDNTDALNSLSTITIPWSNGSKAVYNVLGKSSFPDYFSFVVQYNSTSSLNPPDFANLDYNFTGSFPSSFTVPAGLNDVHYVPIIKDFPLGDYNFPINAEIPFSNGFPSSSIVFDTYPQKDIYIKATGTITNNSSGFNYAVILASLRKSDGSLIPPLAFTPPSINGTDQLFFVVPANSSVNFIAIWDLTPNDMGAGSKFAFITSGVGTNDLSFSSTSKIFISSSLEEGIDTSAVLEPYLDYKFEGSDCDILQNNVLEARPNPYTQDIDYSTSQITPVNQQALLNYNATKGTYPVSNFSITSLINPSYGSENTNELGYNTGSRLNTITSAGTNVIIYKEVILESFDGITGSSIFDPSTVDGTFTFRFPLSYIITNEGEVKNIINDNEVVNELKQNLVETSISSSLPIIQATPLAGMSVIEKFNQQSTSSIPITLTSSAPPDVILYKNQPPFSQTQYTRNTNISISTGSSQPYLEYITSDADFSIQLLLQYPTGAGSFYPIGMEQTTAGENIIKTKEILANNNILI